jgi:hypothetical protein
MKLWSLPDKKALLGQSFFADSKAIQRIGDFGADFCYRGVGSGARCSIPCKTPVLD